MTEPTDAEIDALWRFEASKNWDSTLAMRTSFARAVLAKFGTPAFVGVEPYAQHAIWHGRDGDRGWDQYHDSSDPMPLGWDGDAPDEVIDLYTAAHAQAGAVPLAEYQIHEAIKAFKDSENLMGVNHIHVARAIERAHGIGIKGGQHG
jgi:hypothetical protein